jgi:hypothetical protein
MTGVEEHLLRYSEPGNWAYIAERLSGGQLDGKMDHLVSNSLWLTS